MKSLQASALTLLVLNGYVNSQQTGGAYPAAFKMYANCRDCSANEILSGTAPYGDNGCYNFGDKSVRISCTSAYSTEYTANYYSDTGCGAVMATITGWGTGCVAAGDSIYSNYVNCEYAPAKQPQTANTSPDPNSAVTASLSAPALSTGGPTGTNTGTAGQGSPAGFEGVAASNPTAYGNEVSYGNTGAIIGGKGATPGSQSSSSSGSQPTSIAQANGGITTSTFNPAQATAEAYILSHPPPTSGPQSSAASAQQNDIATSDGKTNQLFIINMAAATTIVMLAWMV